MRTSAALAALLVLAACSNSSANKPAASSTAPSTSPAPVTSSTSAPPSSAPPPSTTSAAPPTSHAPPPSTSQAPPPVDTSQVQAFGDCQHPVARPAEVTLTCADHGVTVQTITWRTWAGGRQASGTGSLYYNDCTPNCAQGNLHLVPNTSIVLSAPVDVGDGLIVWSQATIDPVPPGWRPGPHPLPTRAT